MKELRFRSTDGGHFPNYFGVQTEKGFIPWFKLSTFCKKSTINFLNELFLWQLVFGKEIEKFFDEVA